MWVRSRPFAFVVVLFALLGCTRGGPCVAIVAPDGTTRATVAIEVANTAEQRERGLMFRKHLDDEAGMIFVFPDSQPRDFWMHNTEIPLDMMFADSSFRITGIVADAKPETDTLRGVDGPSAVRARSKRRLLRQAPNQTRRPFQLPELLPPRVGIDAALTIRQHAVSIFPVARDGAFLFAV